MRQGGWQCDTFRPDAQEKLADILHPSGAHGVLPKADFSPLSVLINTDGDVNVGMPVKPTTIRRRAQNSDVKPALSSRIQQVIDGLATEIVKQPAVGFKQGPQRVEQSKDLMQPVAVRQPLKLHGNTQVCGLFTAGRTGTVVTGVGNIPDVRALCVVASILFHAADTGAAGQHFCDSFDFDITQAARIQNRGQPVTDKCSSHPH